jgi:Phage tail tube protein
MSEVAYGSSAKLALARQTTDLLTPQAPGTGVFKFFPAVNFRLGQTQAFEAADLLGLGRDPSRPERGVIDSAGTARVPIDLRYIGHWLTMCMGPPDSTGPDTGGTYTHVWVSGGAGDTITGYTIEQQHEDIASPVFFQHVGVVVDSFTVVLEATGRAYFDLNLFSHGFNVLTSTAAGTPGELTFERFSQFENYLKLAGSTLGKVVRVTMPYANNYSKERYVGGGGAIDEIGPGQTTAAGELVARIKDTTLIDHSTDADVFTLEFGFSKDADRKLSFEFGQAEFARASPGLDGPGGAEITFPLAPSRTVSDPMLTVTLLNDVAGTVYGG